MHYKKTTVNIHKGLDVTIDRTMGIEPSPRLRQNLDRYSDTARINPSYFDSRALNKVAPNHCLSAWDDEHPWHIREPEITEIVAAERMAKALDAATAGGKTRTKVATQLPPGRIHVGSVINNRLARSAGRISSEPMFRRREVSPVHRAPLQVAVIKDLTHSMATFSMLGASLSWVIQEATQQLGGTVTQVDFNHGPWPWQAPGERLPGVLQTATIGPVHNFKRAMMGVESATQFIANPVGPRVLILFTDFRFGLNESAPLPFFGDAGVHIVAITPQAPWAYSRPGGRFTALSDAMQMDYDSMVDAVGSAIVESIESDRAGE